MLLEGLGFRGKDCLQAYKINPGGGQTLKGSVLSGVRILGAQGREFRILGV